MEFLKFETEVYGWITNGDAALLNKLSSVRIDNARAISKSTMHRIAPMLFVQRDR